MNQTGTRIRSLETIDLAAVAALATLLGYPSTLDQLKGRWERVRNEPGRAVFVAELAAGEVVGWVDVHGVHGLATDAYALVAGLVVDEGVRGQGVGRSLMVAAERWAGEQGYQAIRLHSNVTRDAAHAFYARLGYQVMKQSLAFRKTLAAAASDDRATEASSANSGAASPLANMTIPLP